MKIKINSCYKAIVKSAFGQSVWLVETRVGAAVYDDDVGRSHEFFSSMKTPRYQTVDVSSGEIHFGKFLSFSTRFFTAVNKNLPFFHH